MSARAPSRSLIDPGWLFLIAGLTLMGAAVLIPARRDLDLALWRRDRVLAAEMNRLERLTRYETYLDALRHRDETVVRQLASTQLGLAPADSQVLLLVGEGEAEDASVFRALEPRPLELPQPHEIHSVLARLALGGRSQLWLLAASAMLVLIGLLPPGGGHQQG
ncbi:MAG: hypothetical protein H6810_01200 [Phycisphaeraceae bacterium]|nr:MAG: hypothetical protein H6810_01200 [Phycisphaeraceae bacterium]